MARPPATGWVRINSADPPVTLVVRLADARPNVTAGYGGWSEVARPRRRPLSIWQASPGLRLDLPVLFDGFQAGRSVEGQLADLEKLALPGAADGAPARIRIQAQGAAVPHQGKTWVIDSLAWGDGIMNERGNRTRQQVTLSLLEFIADVRISESSASIRQRQKTASVKTKPGAAAKRVVAVSSPHRTLIHGDHGGSGGARSRSSATPATVAAPAGEDLLTIAARELGDADRWIEIAQLNGIRDPRSIAIGQVIRLP